MQRTVKPDRNVPVPPSMDLAMRKVRMVVPAPLPRSGAGRPGSV